MARQCSGFEGSKTEPISIASMKSDSMTGQQIVRFTQESGHPGGKMPPSSVPSLVVPRAWVELLDDIARTPPVLIVDAAAGGLHDFEGHDLGKYPQLRTIVATQYRYDTTTRGGIRIYRRRDGS